MKNFIKTLFAVIFGNAIFFGVFFLIITLLVIGAGISSRSSKNIKISSENILHLNINGGLSDLSENSDMKFRFGNNSSGVASVFDIITALEKAKSDAAVKALWIDLNLNEELSYAQIDLLRQAISDFKQSKKPVIAYGEATSQKMYYLSTAADKILINPNGGLDIRGFGAQLSFFKKTLEKLEIQPQIFYAGKFKSATEPFRLEKMSEENKTQIKELLGDISNVVLNNIAKDRNITTDNLNQSINQLQTMIPAEAQAVGLIDGIAYLDEAEKELKSLLKLKEGDLPTNLSIAKYMDEIENTSQGEGIAVYVAEGDIVDGKGVEGSIASEKMVKDIRTIAKDDDIKALVLRVNSPGGSALASDVILRELELLKKKKPLIVSMGNLAASGGYYISSGADKIFAEPNTITGSIGVFGIIPNIGNFMQNKLGITFDEVELNEHAAMSLNKNLDDIEATKIQQEIDRIYMTFKSVVSKGRKLAIDSVENIAQGRVWSGTRAKQLKLVDEIGGLKEAVAYAAKQVKLTPKDYFFYNNRKNEFELLIADLTGEEEQTSLEEKWLKHRLGSYAKYYDMLKSFEHVRGTQMRMVYQVYGL